MMREHQGYVEGDDDDAGGPGNYVEEAAVDVFAHEVFAVDQDQHQDNDYWKQDAIQDLGEDDCAHQQAVGQGHDGDGSAGDEQGVEPVEEGCFLEAFVYAGFQAQAFADGVSRGERQDGCGEERGVEKAEGE